MQIEISDSEDSISQTIVVVVEAIIVDGPPAFSEQSYTFEIAENVEDTFVIGSLQVTDESKLQCKCNPAKTCHSNISYNTGTRDVWHILH